ncbi:MAG: hypothetical protein IPI23_14225 [Bacteroidetes bacterium]|nr:hypothetical protein [Bacteroidota bacterium]
MQSALLMRGQRITEDQSGKFVRIRDLKENALDHLLNLDTVEEVDIPRQAQKISESCLLLASRWKTLKPTYFIYTGTSIYVSPDTLIFKPDESKCDLVYLINELYSGYVAEQLDSYRTGSVIPMIRKEDLLSIIISLPSLDDQSLERQKKKQVLNRS